MLATCPWRSGARARRDPRARWSRRRAGQTLPAVSTECSSIPARQRAGKALMSLRAFAHAGPEARRPADRRALAACASRLPGDTDLLLRTGSRCWARPPAVTEVSRTVGIHRRQPHQTDESPHRARALRQSMQLLGTRSLSRDDRRSARARRSEPTRPVPSTCCEAPHRSGRAALPRCVCPRDRGLGEQTSGSVHARSASR